MHKPLGLFGSLLIALTVGACASSGTNIQRVPEPQLLMGTTTQDEIVGRLGKPRQISDEVKNGQQVSTIVYTYATTYTTDSRVAGVASARSQSFSFHDGRLVGHNFTSNFESEKTDFDESAVPSFQEKVTTKADVVQVLGEPTGKQVYPLVDTAGDEAFLYVYGYVDTRKANFPVYREHLTIVFGPDGVAKKITLEVRDDT